jgi:hypothetical protein
LIKKNLSIAFDYVEEVVKGRWIEAEDTILNGKKKSLEYCLRYNAKLPEAIHNKVLTEVAFDSKVPNLDLKKKYVKWINYLK